MSYIPTGPVSNDKHQKLKKEYLQTRDELTQTLSTLKVFDRELMKKIGELKNTKNRLNHVQHENQQLKDTNSGLQNECNNVRQQLKDAKALCEVFGKELFDARAFLTKANALSISEVGEKVTALNEEIVLAAATLGEAIIHKCHEVSQTDMDAAAAVSKEMVGEKMTDILITQSQKPEPNSLLVQVVLQMIMVKFCVSKIQSWNSGDSAIGGFFSALYSEIRSTGKHRIDSEPSFT